MAAVTSEPEVRTPAEQPTEAKKKGFQGSALVLPALFFIAWGWALSGATAPGTKTIDGSTLDPFNGKLLFSWDATGTAPGGFGELHQFSVDSKGNVYTADNVLGRPQKLIPKPGADPAHLIGQAVKLTPKAR